MFQEKQTIKFMAKLSYELFLYRNVWMVIKKGIMLKIHWLGYIS